MNQSGFSSNKTNFTHAALLLQNSSSVYSRKVEYLYRLVYESLDKLILETALQKGNKSKQRGGGKDSNGSSSKKRKSRDKDISAFEEFDPEMAFLLLDDVLPIDEDGGKITLPQEETKINNPIIGGNNLTPWTIHRGRRRGRSNTMSEIRGGSIGLLSTASISRLDSTMMTNSTRGGSKITASNMAQNMVQRLLSDGTEPATSGEGGTLRLANGTCDICANGAFLIPGTSLNPLAESDNVQEGSSRNGDVAPSQLDLSMEGEDQNGNNKMIMPMEEEMVGNDDYDTYDDGPGFELPQDNHEDGEVEASTNSQPNISTIGQEGGPLSLEHIEELQVAQKSAKEKPDPWSLLDPQDVSALKSRTLRIRTTYHLPEECDDPPSNAVTGTRTRKILKIRRRRKRSSSNDESREVVHTCTQSLKAMKIRMEQRLSMKNEKKSEMNLKEDKAWTIPLCPSSDFVFGNEFVYIAKAQSQRRVNEKRRMRTEEAARRAESKIAAIVDEHFRDVHEAGGDDDDNNGYYGDDYDYGDGEDDYDPGAIDQVDNANACIKDFDEIIDSVEDEESNGNMNRKIKFEALCRAHLKEFTKGAEKYAVKSKLSKRVGLWQDKVTHVLEDEEHRPVFDIKDYSRQLINTIQRGVELDKTEKLTLGFSGVSLLFDF